MSVSVCVRMVAFETHVPPFSLRVQIFQFTKNLRDYIVVADFHAHTDWINWTMPSADGKVRFDCFSLACVTVYTQHTHTQHTTHTHTQHLHAPQFLLSAADDRLVHMWDVDMALHACAPAPAPSDDIDSCEQETAQDGHGKEGAAAKEKRGAQARARETAATTRDQSRRLHEREVVGIFPHPQLPLFFTASRDKTAAVWEVVPALVDAADTSDAAEAAVVGQEQASTQAATSDHDVMALTHAPSRQLFRPAVPDRISCVLCDATGAPSSTSLAPLNRGGGGSGGGDASGIGVEVRQVAVLSNDEKDWVTCVTAMRSQPTVIFGTENKTLRFHRWDALPRSLEAVESGSTELQTAPAQYTEDDAGMQSNNNNNNNDSSNDNSRAVLEPKAPLAITGASVIPQVQTLEVSYRIAGAAMSSDDAFVFVLDHRGALHLFEANGTYVVKLQHIEQRLGAVAVRDEFLLATGKDTAAVLVMHWERESQTLRVVRTFEGQGGAGTAVCFVGGRRVASASTNGTVHVWDCGERGREVVIRGHTDVVDAVAASVEGHVLATGSRDAAVIVSAPRPTAIHERTKKKKKKEGEEGGSVDGWVGGWV